MTVITFPGRDHAGSGHGEFFAVDRRVWAAVCGSAERRGLGINASVAYLVLARGTGRDNRLTSWSVNAIEQRDLMSRGRAQTAIDALKAGGVIRQTASGGKATRYELLSAAEVPGISADLRGQEPKTRARGETAAELAARHAAWVRRVEEAANLDPVWLPNALVDGAPGDVAPPLELVRRTQDPLALRLLVDMYHAQDLAEHGALSWRIYRRKYEREQAGQNGPLAIWAFYSDVNEIWPHLPVFAAHFRGEKDSPERQEAAKAFWTRFDTLRNLGLVEEVPYLVEADTDEAEAIHACAIRSGESIERDIGHAARAAALALLPPEKAETFRDMPGVILAPVPFEYQQVQLFGLARLRYRSRNARTGAWWARLQEEGPKVAERLRAIASAEGREKDSSRC